MVLGIDPNTNFVYSLSSSTKVEELFVVPKRKKQSALYLQVVPMVLE